MTSKKLLAATLATTMGMGIASTADALTFYTKGYGGFVDGSWSTDPFPSPQGEVGSFINDGDTIWYGMSWGTAQGGDGPFSGKSGAIINEPQANDGYAVLGENVFQDIAGSQVTPKELLGTLTHVNEPIDQWWQQDGTPTRSSGMTANVASVKVRYVLDLYDDAARTSLIASVSSKDLGDFDVKFQETLNQTNCTAPTPNNTNCDDIFQFGPLNASAPFSYNGVNYTVALSGFYSDPEFTNLTGKLYTGEGTYTLGYVAEFKVVPEPASLALLGLGLVGMGVARRRVRKG